MSKSALILRNTNVIEERVTIRGSWCNLEMKLFKTWDVSHRYPWNRSPVERDPRPLKNGNFCTVQYDRRVNVGCKRVPRPARWKRGSSTAARTSRRHRPGLRPGPRALGDPTAANQQKSKGCKSTVTWGARDREAPRGIIFVFRCMPTNQLHFFC